jgi:hypothetical protein
MIQKAYNAQEQIESDTPKDQWSSVKNIGWMVDGEWLGDGLMCSNRIEGWFVETS